MLNTSLRCILGLAVVLACAAPAAAQQPSDPLTRFLDSIFKPGAQGRAGQPHQVAPAQQVAPAPARPAPQTRAKAQPRRKVATPPPRPVPPPQVAEPQPDIETEPTQAVASPQPQVAPPESAQPTETTAAKPAAPEPTLEELSRQAAEEGASATAKAEEAQPEPAPSEEKAAAAPESVEPDAAVAEEAKPEEAAPPVKVAEPPKPASPPPASVKAAEAPAPAPAKVAAKAPAAPALPSSPEAALDQVNAYFNGIDQLTATFVQKNPSGQQAQGTLAIKRPGILHFAYAPPSALEIVSDGRNVAIRDKSLGTNDVYPVGQTPLKFLLQEHVDLSRDTKVRDVQVARDGMVTVRFDDSATLGGTSRITLRFDARANALKQWTIVDGQGYETTVTLSNLNVVQK
ncbi:LolA family protein [Microvirga roseola]|uniref:LolA family protein n=1 Tax=Microvirga roseola TaxID=2883126 RepID=UPI001E631E00|nr:outer-membrane lipoprotein carrier protein LolA [Microvirga roseola]